MQIFYCLSKDVFLVEGAKKHCIYDLNQGDLYHIDDEVFNFIKSITTDTNKKLDTQEQEFVNELLSLSILATCDKAQTGLPDILSLRKNIPLSFSWIEVTRTCNLACTFCYEESNPNCKERMTVEMFKNIAGQLVEVGVSRIQFIGGEPMILKDELKQMIDYARPKFAYIEVYSNGVLIDDSWASYFKENKIHVALSIHSYIPEEHDRLTTVPGSHRRVVRGLELLKKYGVKYRIGTVSDKSCRVGEKPESAGYTLRPADTKIVGRGDFSQYTFEMFRKKAITKDKKKYPLDKNRVVAALSGHQCFNKEIYISTEGDVYPCVMERRTTHGSMKTQPLKEMINPSIRKMSKDNIEGCKTCEFRYGCFDCRPDSNGRGLYQKPWYCSYNPTTSEWADLEEMYKYLTKKSISSIERIPIVQEAT